MPFKIFADFECNFKRVRGCDRNDNTSYTEKYQPHIPCSFAYKIVCVTNKPVNQFSKPVVFYREKKMQFIDLLKQFLKSMIIAEK